MFGFNPLYAACILAAGGMPAPAFSLNFLYGDLDPAVSFSRTSNATMFDAQGNLVWAPANMLSNSGTGGAVVGVIGSGGATPTGWLWSSAPGIVREVVAFDDDYIDVRLSGTNSSGGTVYPQVAANQIAVSAVPGDYFYGSQDVQIIAGSLAGFASSACKLNLQHLNGGAYVNESTPSAAATTDMQRLASFQNPVAGGANGVRLALNFSIPNGGTVDITVRLGRPQIERIGPDSPKSYVKTTGTAYYGPRLDYDPGTLSARGLLIELSRTNLSPIIGMFGQSGYVYGGIVGNPTAGSTKLGWQSHRFTADGAATQHYCSGGSSASIPTASTAHTASVYIFGASADRVQLTASTAFAPADAYVNFELSTLTVTAQGAGATAASILQVASGVWRLSMTFTVIASPAGGAACLLAIIATGLETRLPNLTSTDWIEAFGYQLEAGDFPTSLIPTYGAAATRSGDLVTVPLSTWYTQGSGTLVVKGILPKLPSGLFPNLLSVDDGTGNNRIQLFGFTSASATTVGSRVDDGGVIQVNTGVANSVAFYDQVRYAVSFALNAFRQVGNGGAVLADTSCTIPAALTTLRVGSNPGSGTSHSRWIQQVAYYSIQATNEQLQALTL